MNRNRDSGRRPSWARATKPAVAELRQEGYQIETVDIRRDPARAESLSVRSIPTFIFFSEDREIRGASGNLSCDEIRHMFRSPDAWF